MNKLTRLDLATGGAFGLGLGGGKNYSAKVINTIGKSSIVAYWPLSETSGTTATDIANGLTGTISGATVGQPGIGDGRTSISFDGGDSIDIYSAALNTGMNKDECTMAIWAKIDADATWTDGANHYTLILQTDTNNRARIYKITTNNTLSLYQILGATAKQNTTTSSSLGWLHLCLTWSKAGDAMITYVNGAKLGSTLTGLGTWVGDLASAACVIGASTSASALGWKGWLAHALICNRALTATEVLKIATV